ncbi:MAG: phenylalanine--tRNA ligase subunit alpha [Patescibacteria group bacterium]|nr:phenylalanine--tRNA ligase subunit alpha [Patescibacteria group bacterium]
MEEELVGIKNAAISFTLECNSLEELEEVKLQFLGRSGKLTQTIKNIATVPLEKRPEIGMLANEIKNIIEETIEQKHETLKSEHYKKRKEAIDITKPGIKPKIGHIHPITQTILEMIDIFKGIGFQVADGPEIETDYYNFEALNIPKDHPSRDTQQTLYLDTRNSKVEPGEVILRTQTSNMQGRIMQKIKPPFRVIVPGKVYRYEQVDASHGFEFWQLEGFTIDKNITMSDLFGTLDYFIKKFYGNDTKVKFVCHNFPFVEPGAEAYITCTVCKGKGCTFCKRSGWVEMLGAGMIHPNVLKAAKIDPNEWQGFAFGTGFSRMATLKYQMDDLRLLTNPDLRILNQF